MKSNILKEFIMGKKKMKIEEIKQVIEEKLGKSNSNSLFIANAQEFYKFLLPFIDEIGEKAVKEFVAFIKNGNQGELLTTGDNLDLAAELYLKERNKK